MNLAAWRDASLVLLALQTLLLVIVVGAVLYFLNRGMAALRRTLRRTFPLVQARLWRVAEISRQVSEKAVAPVIRAETAAARIHRWFISLRAFTRQ